MAVGSWRYRPSPAAGIVEWGDVHGRAVALPTHFHDEDQITFVLAGRRRFQLADRSVILGAGEGVALPAGTLHASLDEPDGALCRNVYLPAGSVALADVVAAFSRGWRQRGGWDEPALLALLRHHHLPEPSPVAPMVAQLRGSVKADAARTGLSREGFSRAFRRCHGLAPQPFRALMRLNAARRSLRAGVPPAEAAADAGFADQSHLGRAFLRTFGVTPGSYRAGVSHPFQTERRQRS